MTTQAEDAARADELTDLVERIAPPGDRAPDATRDFPFRGRWDVVKDDRRAHVVDRGSARPTPSSFWRGGVDPGRWNGCGLARRIPAARRIPTARARRAAGARDRSRRERGSPGLRPPAASRGAEERAGPRAPARVPARAASL